MAILSDLRHSRSAKAPGRRASLSPKGAKAKREGAKLGFVRIAIMIGVKRTTLERERTMLAAFQRGLRDRRKGASPAKQTHTPSLTYKKYGGRDGKPSNAILTSPSHDRGSRNRAPSGYFSLRESQAAPAKTMGVHRAFDMWDDGHAMFGD